MTLTKAWNDSLLPSVEILFVEADDVATLDEALAADDGFKGEVTAEDMLEGVALALAIFDEDD